MNIGICGGTFDPFHRGHLDPILRVRPELQWDRVIYVPAYVQPFKQDRRTESSYHRFAMAALATEGQEGLFVSPRELERGAVSYTVDTLTELRTEHPGATIDWIIGDDNLAGLHKWKSIDRITQLANFVVLTRRGGAAGFSPAEIAGGLKPAGPQEREQAGSIVFARNETVPVSSTEIRMRIRQGQSIEDLVPAAVSRYIHHYDLYRKGPS
jgi:nicotinate-nucleotide adenylyltransferase